jgi:TorA maturation chaperone TorD
MAKEQHEKELAALCAIKGEQLVAVTFIQDYVQLAFGASGFSAFNWPSVWVNDQVWEPTTQFYRDRLCEQITKTVSEVELTDEKIVIVFDDGSRIEMSLKVTDGCAEAAMFTNSATGYMGVWN